MAVIGILHNYRHLEQMIRGTSFENIKYYFELAEKYKINICFYTIKDISWSRNNVYGYIYNFDTKTLIKEEVNLPKINLCRAIIRQRKTIRKIEQLAKQYNVRFINYVLGSKRDKYQINEYLASKPIVKNYIPKTKILSFETLNQYLNEYQKVVIKPRIGSLGKNIVFIKAIKEKYRISSIVRRKVIRKEINKDELYKYYQESFDLPHAMLIQPWIAFLTHDGKPFDIRVTIQKKEDGVWSLTGIVAKVASEKKLVTNIYQAGEGISFKDLKINKHAFFYKKIEELSINIAKTLELKFPQMADYGLDIAIDQDHHLWFIEANFRDQRYSYRESNDLDMWRATYETPFRYALALLNRKSNS